MAAPRATQFIALRNLTRSTRPTRPKTSTRSFQTSPTRHAVHDSSTIDFAFLPASETLHLDDDASNTASELLRVPIIPTNFAPRRTGAHAPEAVDLPVMKPQISSMSIDAVFAPLAESHDDHAPHADFARRLEHVADSVAAGLQRLQTAGGESWQLQEVQQTTVVGGGEGGIVGQLWRGLVEDVLGRGKGGGKGW